MKSELVSQGQILALRSLLQECAGADLDHEARTFILTRLTSRDIHSSKEVLLSEWRVIRNSAFPHWGDGDWDTITPDFKNRVLRFLNEYREEYLGQQRMF